MNLLFLCALLSALSASNVVGSRAVDVSRQLKYEECAKICTTELFKHCASDGTVYSNMCLFKIAQCMDPQLSLVADGIECEQLSAANSSRTLGGLRDRTSNTEPRVEAVALEAQGAPPVCPGDCALWFDGCNECRCMEGHPCMMACTRKACSVLEEPHCIEPRVEDVALEAQGAPPVCPGDCALWFDGCNECRCVKGNPSLMACTLKACSVLEEPHCIEPRVEEPSMRSLNALPVCPGDCALWFDGCNECRCVKGNPNLMACTLKACSVLEEPHCIEPRVEEPSMRSLF